MTAPPTTETDQGKDIVPAEPEVTGTSAKRAAKSAMAGDRAIQAAKDAVAAQLDPNAPLAEPEPTPEPEPKAAAPEPEPEDKPLVELSPVDAEPTPEPEPEPEPEPAEPAPEVRTIPIDPNHPIAGSGVKQLFAHSEQEERVIRGLLSGTYTRKKELLRQAEEIDRLQEHITRNESKQAVQQKWQATPEYQKVLEEYKEIEETVGKDPANAFYAGKLAEQKAAADAEFKVRWEAHQSKQQEEAGIAWAEDAFERTQTMPPGIRGIPNFQQIFGMALKSFNSEIAMGQISVEQGDEEAMHREFTNFFGSRLVRLPEVQEAYKKMRADEADKDGSKTVADTKAATDQREAAIRRQAVEDYKQEAAKKRKDQPLHPLGKVPGVNRGTLPSVSSDAEQQEEIATLSPHDLKRRLKAEARKDSRRHVPQ